MFSFIRNFFENRCKRAAERDRLCQDLLHRVSKALSDYIDVDKDDKECIQKWRSENGNLVGELNDIRRFKRCSSYRELNLQKKKFDEFYAHSYDRIQTVYARERQKQEESKLVSKKLKQLVSKQKNQKFKVVESKGLNRKLGMLTSHLMMLFHLMKFVLAVEKMYEKRSFIQQRLKLCLLQNNVPKKEVILCVFIHVLMEVDFISQVIRIKCKNYPISTQFSEKELSILKMLKENSALTQGEMAQKLGWDANQVKYCLNKLRNAQNPAIRHVGTTRTGRWEVLMEL